MNYTIYNGRNIIIKIYRLKKRCKKIAKLTDHITAQKLILHCLACITDLQKFNERKAKSSRHIFFLLTQ